MSKKELNFNWDGEKIIQSIPEEKIEMTPKDVLNGIDHLNFQINKAKEEKDKAQASVKKLGDEIERLNNSLKKVKEFEEKCVEIQMEKIAGIIKELTPELAKKAKSDADEIIGADPKAYSEEQKRLMPYHNFQKLLATHEKVAAKIANRIMRSAIYANPIYENPFK